MIENGTKIIATLGPKTNSQEMITKLAHAGTSVFRINFSHAAPEEARQDIEWVRQTERLVGRPLAVMVDAPGPKIRIGTVAPDAQLIIGQTVEIFEKTVDGNASKFSLNYPEIVREIRKDAKIYVDDGALILKAKGDTENGIVAEVIVGGPLLSKKGFSSEGITINPQGVLPKDKIAIETAVANGADAIAVSFVQTANDLHAVRDYIQEVFKELKQRHIMLIAKIETQKGVENIDEIIKAADGIMIARGDLGLAVPIEDVPAIQKALILKALRAAKQATEVAKNNTIRKLTSGDRFVFTAGLRFGEPGSTNFVSVGVVS